MKTDSFFPLPSSCVTFDDTIHSNVLSVGYFKGILIHNSVYESNKIDTLLCVWGMYFEISFSIVM